MSGDRDELIARAEEDEQTPLVDPTWGYRISLEPGETFVGRWRGLTVDEANENRPVYLFWDEAGERCFSRHYASLGAKIKLAEPQIGHSIAVRRGADYASGKGNPGFSFGIAVSENDEPLPEDDDDVDW